MCTQTSSGQGGRRTRAWMRSRQMPLEMSRAMASPDESHVTGWSGRESSCQ